MIFSKKQHIVFDKIKTSGFCTLFLFIATFSSSLFSQTTVTLEDQCNCEVLKGTEVSVAGSTTPAGAEAGDIYVNTDTGALFFWDGDSWEVANISAGEWAKGNFNGEDLIYAKQAMAAGDTLVVTDRGTLGVGTASFLGEASIQKNDREFFDILVSKDNKKIGNPITGATSEIFGSDLSFVRSQNDSTFWDTGLRLYNFGDIPSRRSHIALRKGRGTFEVAQDLMANDVIGNIVFEPVNPANAIKGSPSGGGVELLVRATEDHIDGRGAAELGINIAPGTDQTRVNRFLLNNEGYLGLNTNAPFNRLHVKDTLNPVRFEGLQDDLDPNNKVVVANTDGVLKTVPIADLGAGEWADGTFRGEPAIYAKQALASGDTVALKDNGQFRIGSMGDFGDYAVTPQNFAKVATVNKVTENDLDIGVNDEKYAGFFVNQMDGLSGEVRDLHHGLRGEVNVLPNSTANYGALRGFLGEISNQGSGTLANPTGIVGVTVQRGSGAITNANGGVFSTSIDAVGSGNITNAFGLNTRVVNNSENGSTITNAIGVKAVFVDNADAIENIQGVRIENVDKASVVGKGISIANIDDDDGAQEYYGIEIGSVRRAQTNYGVKIGQVMDGVDNYGLFIDRVRLGTGNNYAIYTNEGDIRFGGLVEELSESNDLVVSRPDGVLRTMPTDAIANFSPLRKESTSYTMLEADGTVLVDASAGSVTVTLPAPVLGKKIIIKKIDTTNNSLVLDGGTASIDGMPNRTTTLPYQAFTLQGDGTDWYIISK